MKKTIYLILRCVALGVAVGALVLKIMHIIDNSTTVLLLSIGMVCIALAQLQNNK